MILQHCYIIYRRVGALKFAALCFTWKVTLGIAKTAVLFPCSLPFFTLQILYLLPIFSCEGNLLHTLWLLCCVLPACFALLPASNWNLSWWGTPFSVHGGITGVVWFGLGNGHLLFLLVFKVEADCAWEPLHPFLGCWDVSAAWWL